MGTDGHPSHARRMNVAAIWGRETPLRFFDAPLNPLPPSLRVRQCEALRAAGVSRGLRATLGAGCRDVSPS